MRFIKDMEILKSPWSLGFQLMDTHDLMNISIILQATIIKSELSEDMGRLKSPLTPGFSTNGHPWSYEYQYNIISHYNKKWLYRRFGRLKSPWPLAFQLLGTCDLTCFCSLEVAGDTHTGSWGAPPGWCWCRGFHGGREGTSTWPASLGKSRLPWFEECSVGSSGYKDLK